MTTPETALKLKPLGDKVIVEVIDEPQTTAGGIVLPDSAKEKSQRGKVLAVGSGKLLDNGERVPLEIKEGDTIVFAKYGGTEVNLEGKELMILSERDVHAVVE
ncbi:MAG: co-chaperone GroES [Trueperaceae bacterium]|nr:MAG: co-chaperone GroES [Trueperaceae bacterium]